MDRLLDGLSLERDFVALYELITGELQLTRDQTRSREIRRDHAGLGELQLTPLEAHDRSPGSNRDGRLLGAVLLRVAVHRALRADGWPNCGNLPLAALLQLLAEQPRDAMQEDAPR